MFILIYLQLKMLRSSLPIGIYVKGFEDRMVIIHLIFIQSVKAVKSNFLVMFCKFHEILIFFSKLIPNNAVTPKSLIVLLLFFPIQQFCNTTKLDCTHAISSHQTMLWHHKAWLYSFYFFPSNTAVTLQSFIVLMLFLPVPQCCDTTKQALLQFMT